MRALDRKIIRDLWHMKGQAVAIAFVMAGGVATYVMSVSTLDTLKLTQATFYRDARFAEVFAVLKRAPESLKSRIEQIPGVSEAATGVVAAVNLDVPGYADPVTGMIVSTPDDGRPTLNRTFIKRGRAVDPTRDNEALVSDAFAAAHSLEPGDSLYAIINGRRKRLDIVGIALSAEYVYQLQPGSIIPDFKSYAILWMARRPLAAAYNMEGAFNSAALALERGVRPEEVIDPLDDLLRRYGGLGAVSREDQTSHRYLSEEFKQLESMASMFPVIFLGVAAFLLNVAISRVIATQREQVAILKAFGYTNVDVTIHYLKLVVLITLLGVALGIAVGVWMAQGMSNMYMEFYRFPYMLYHLQPRVAVTAALICAAAAIAGTLYSVIRAASIPPAEAMQPAPPARYRVSLVERLGLGRILAQPTRMIVRNLERRPVKALLSALGIAMACGILLMSGFYRDAIDMMVNVQFKLAQRDDITVTFIEPTSRRALYSLESLEGVEYAEPFRSVPVRLRHGHRTYRTSIQGRPPGGRLNRLLDENLRPFEAPPDTLVLTDHLAKILQARVGDLLTVEVLEGRRPTIQVPLGGTVKEYIGVTGYMQLPALNRLLKEGPVISGAYMATDARYRKALYAELKEIPRVAGAAVREQSLVSFYETMAKQILLFAFFNTMLAGSISFGVVYNSARIALSERSRELASLRVLGLTRGEISYILLGELALLTLAALPLGFLVGRALCGYLVANTQTDLFRVPLVINEAGYAWAASVVLASTLISGVIVKRRLDRLDLVAVLKTKE
jgi:putative ABC transport system permease protein